MHLLLHALIHNIKEHCQQNNKVVWTPFQTKTREDNLSSLKYNLINLSTGLYKWDALKASGFCWSSHGERSTCQGEKHLLSALDAGQQLGAGRTEREEPVSNACITHPCRQPEPQKERAPQCFPVLSPSCSSNSHTDSHLDFSYFNSQRKESKKVTHADTSETCPGVLSPSFAELETSGRMFAEPASQHTFMHQCYPGPPCFLLHTN